jgi:hypothetical protein
MGALYTCCELGTEFMNIIYSNFRLMSVSGIDDVEESRLPAFISADGHKLDQLISVNFIKIYSYNFLAFLLQLTQCY